MMMHHHQLQNQLQNQQQPNHPPRRSSSRERAERNQLLEAMMASRNGGCPPHPHTHPPPHLPPERMAGPPHGHGGGGRPSSGGVNRILSRNANGTIAMTSQPSNESELQLYRVLQRANLLSYYDTFITQGGDDVQQLCEAGEEEFLEIMALVGMASKPLHVRRLQKALQEWVQNPVAFLATAMFQGGPPPPLPVEGRPPPGFPHHHSVPPHHSHSHHPSLPPSAHHPGMPPLPPPQGQHHSPSSQTPLPQSSSGSQPLALPAPPTPPKASSQAAQSPPLGHHQHMIAERLAVAAAISAAAISASSSKSPSNRSRSPINLSSGQSNSDGRLRSSSFLPSGGRNTPNDRMIGSNGNEMQPFSITSTSTRDNLITNEYGQPASPISLTPILMDSQIQRLAEAAEQLVKSLPPMDPKFLSNNRKRVSKEVEHVMNMSDDDPRRLDEIRKYAAIYGRFDCKRKPEKPLTLHEVSVNEAAAQICRHIPALLTRRDELFPLARQVVRDSGYQYSKGHSRSQFGSLGLKRSFDESSGMSGGSDRTSDGNGNGHHHRKFFHSDGDRKSTDGDTDSQYSLYSNPNSDSNDQNITSPANDGQDTMDCEEISNSPRKRSKDNDDNEGNAVPEQQEIKLSPTTIDHKLLPAKKSGNFGSAAQLAKQLVQETLLDEGLRVVKEFNHGLSGDVIESSKGDDFRPSLSSQERPSGRNGDLAGMTTLDLTTMIRGNDSSPPPSHSETPVKHPWSSTPLQSPLGHRESLMTPPSIPFQPAPMPPMPPRRGRPPKNPQLYYQSHLQQHHQQLLQQGHHSSSFLTGHPGIDVMAAYHEKLQQHLQQTFLASQMMAQFGQQQQLSKGVTNGQRMENNGRGLGEMLSSSSLASSSTSASLSSSSNDSPGKEANGGANLGTNGKDNVGANGESGGIVRDSLKSNPIFHNSNGNEESEAFEKEPNHEQQPEQPLLDTQAVD